MKKRIDDQTRVIHMLEAIQKIKTFTNGIDAEAFYENEILQLAIVRLVEIIGEASNYISPETKLASPEIDWRVLYGIRNIIAHQYFGINYAIIWGVVEQDILVLHPQLNNLLLRLTPTP
jgi:uncharacterized protein with HEPN domain